MDLDLKLLELVSYLTNLESLKLVRLHDVEVCQVNQNVPKPIGQGKGHQRPKRALPTKGALEI